MMKKVFGLKKFAFERFFFDQCQVKFSYREILSFFGQYHVTFSIYGTSFLFWQVCTKRNSLLFFRFFQSENDSVFRWRLSFYKSFPIFLLTFQKPDFYFCKHLRKMNCEQKNPIAHHDAEMSFLPNSRRRIS